MYSPFLARKIKERNVGLLGLRIIMWELIPQYRRVSLSGDATNGTCLGTCRNFESGLSLKHTSKSVSSIRPYCETFQAKNFRYVAQPSPRSSSDATPLPFTHHLLFASFLEYTGLWIALIKSTLPVKFSICHPTRFKRLTPGPSWTSAVSR